MTIRNQSDLRDNNIRSILQTLLRHGSASRRDLCSLTGLTPSAMTALSRELLEAKMVREAPSTKTKQVGAGRSPILLSLSNKSHVAIGVEIGAHFFKLGTVGLAGKILSIAEHQWQRGISPGDAVHRILGLVREEIADRQANGSNVVGVGISVPGLISGNEGVVRFSPNLGWRDVKLLEHFKNHLPVPVMLDNNVHLMAIGEDWLGQGTQGESLVFVHVGTGVGCGVVLPKLGLLRGSREGAGELGHCTILPEGPTCNCGKNGCLEALISEPYLTARYKTAKTDLSGEEITLKDLVTMAEAGELEAVRTLKRATDYLGLGISNIVNLFEPDRIVLNGNPLVTSALTSQWIKEATEKYSFSKDLGCNFTASSFELDQAVVGAAAEIFKRKLFHL